MNKKISVVELMCPKCGHSRGGHTAAQCWHENCSCSNGWSKCTIHPTNNSDIKEFLDKMTDKWDGNIYICDEHGIFWTHDGDCPRCNFGWGEVDEDS